MDNLATILATIIVLTVPLLLWARFKSRATHVQQLAEIKALSEDRSRLLSDLHSRLDALEREDSLQEKADDEDVNNFRLTMALLCRDISKKRNNTFAQYYMAFKRNNAVLERHYFPLGTMRPEVSYRTYQRWLKESLAEQDWPCTAIYEPSKIEEPRWDRNWQHGNREFLRGRKQTLQLA